MRISAVDSRGDSTGGRPPTAPPKGLHKGAFLTDERRGLERVCGGEGWGAGGLCPYGLRPVEALARGRGGVGGHEGDGLRRASLVGSGRRLESEGARRCSRSSGSILCEYRLGQAFLSRLTRLGSSSHAAVSLSPQGWPEILAINAHCPYIYGRGVLARMPNLR